MATRKKHLLNSTNLESMFDLHDISATFLILMETLDHFSPSHALNEGPDFLLWQAYTYPIKWLMYRA
jgi:hypothetical protein